MGNGIGSIIFAALVLGYCVLLLFVLGAVPGTGTVLRLISLGIDLLAAAALLSAGVLAIQADQPYRDWRQAHRPAPRRRPRRYDDEYDDYERRPRR
jgi:hypothetical protein